MEEWKRYILFIIFSVLGDWVYFNILTRPWHAKHMNGMWTSINNNANEMAIRITAAVCFYIIYGSAFAFFTTGMDNDVIHYV